MGGVLIAAFAAVHAACGSAAPGPAAHRYIVILDAEVADPESTALDTVRTHGGALHFVYSNAVKGFAATLPGGAAFALQLDPRVAHLEEDQLVLALPPSAPGELQRLFPEAIASVQATDADVALLDTGLALDAPHLNAVGRVDCTGEAGAEVRCRSGGEDRNGHGSRTAELIGAISDASHIGGVIPGVRLWGVKVLDDDGTGYVSSLIAGIDWVTARAGEIEVATMSLGCLCSSAALDMAIASSADAGVAYTVSVEKTENDLAYTPGNHPDVMKVSAQDGLDAVLGHAGEWIDVRSRGAVGDGVTDDTAAIQAALATGGHVVVPSGTYKIGLVTLPTGVTLWLRPGAVLYAANGTLSEFQRLLNINQVSDVTIYGYGATVTMAGQYTTGEQRHNVDIRGSTRIRIFGLRSVLAGGDGFYVGRGAVQTWSEDVLLQDCISTRNRRQGLSIVSGVNIGVRGGSYSNTGKGAAGGTAPQAGIDIEPNGSPDRIENIRLEDVVTAGNNGNGIMAYLNRFSGTGKPFSIEIVDHMSRDDDVGFWVGTFVAGATPSTGGITYAHGRVTRPRDQGIAVRNYDVSAPPILLDHPVVLNANESGRTSAKYGSGIVLYREASDTGPTTLGNVTITAPDVYDGRSSAKMVTAIHTRDEVSPGTMRYVVIDDPLRLGWEDPAKAGSEPLDLELAAEP